MKSLITTTLLATALLTSTASAGDGTYDATFGFFDFGVSVRFNATQMQLDRMEQEFEKASLLICDASDGQQEFGEIVVCNNSRGGKAAEYWILENGRSNAPGRYGVAGQHINQYYSDIVSSSSKADGSWVIAHEFGHHAYGIKDEYAGPTAGSGLKCVATPANPDTQTACLIENFWIRGADGVSLTEWCVASNHDPDGDTYQDDINDESCWETIVEAYPDLTAPAALPDPGPGGPLLAFSWTVLEEENRFAVVIDKSGSMASSMKMELAQLGGKIFTNLVTPPDKLGVVAFDSFASDIFPMQATTAGVKAAAKAAIDTLNAGGGTSIGAGLANAVNMIVAQGDRACQQAIVLLSDGVGGNHLGVLAQLLDNGIVVHTIALGSGADVGTMQQIASDTGGKFFSATAGGQLPAIFAQLAADVAEGGVLNTMNGTAAPGDVEEATFEVDDTSTSASFVASWNTSPGDVLVTLSGPTGTYDTTGEGGTGDYVFSIDGSSVSMTLTGDALAPGDWTVELDADNASQALAWSVQAISDSKTISFAAEADESEYVYPAPMTVSATVTYGTNLTGVSVSGVVRRPSGTEAPIVLMDDGSDESGDEVAGDGIYTGRFSSWSEDGAYTVALDAVNDGSAMIVAGEGLSLSSADDTVPGEFTRHSEFSVTATGVPMLREFGLGIDVLKASVNPNNAAKSKVRLKGQLELDMLAVQPLVDTLRIEVGGLDYVIPPSMMKRVGKKDRYVFNDKANKTKGFVDLFNKGSSKGSFLLNDKTIPGFFGSFSSVFVGFEWGGMDVSNFLGANPNKKNTATTFNGNKDTISLDDLVPTSLVASKNLKKEDKDRVTFRARLGGGGFNILSGTTTFRVGPFEHMVPASSWKTNKKGTKAVYTSDDKTVTIRWDTEKQQLLFIAKKVDLGELTNPIILEVTDTGGFSERIEITAATNKNGSKLTY